MIRLGSINDTIKNMSKTRKNQLLEIIRNNKGINSSSLLLELKEDISLITIKRDLQSLVKSGYIFKFGAGRSVGYEITLLGKIQNPLDARDYCSIEQDKRTKEVLYNFGISEISTVSLFTEEENSILEASTKKYFQNKKNISETIHKKELERFIIELSWKSSQIEGNTYSLLDTERLLKDGIISSKNTKEEAIMILNHKKAFDFVLKNVELAKKINISFIEEIHKILVKDLSVTYGLRKSVVRITGSNYVPLGTVYQITEAIQKMCESIDKARSPYEKGLITLALLSYIQPFEDGNKRTARLVANAVMLAYDLAPLSYRNVDEVLYKEAMLTFYETNSIYSIKNIFTEQYLFSCKNYNISN
jgi:Fic family protein